MTPSDWLTRQTGLRRKIFRKNLASDPGFPRSHPKSPGVTRSHSVGYSSGRGILDDALIPRTPLDDGVIQNPTQ
jgi:hypothetical protein